MEKNFQMCKKCVRIVKWKLREKIHLQQISRRNKQDYYYQKQNLIGAGDSTKFLNAVFAADFFFHRDNQHLQNAGIFFRVG